MVLEGEKAWRACLLTEFAHCLSKNDTWPHREIKDRDRITSFPPCTTMSQKIDKEIRISLSMSSVFYPQSL